MGTWPIPNDWIGFRVCSNCEVRMNEGYILAGEYACCDECTIALYKGYEEQLRSDLDEKWLSPKSTDCIWTEWYNET